MNTNNLHFMSVDPGYLGTGYAIWEQSSREELCSPVAAGILEIKNGKGAEWISRAGDFAKQLTILTDLWNISEIHCEFPRLFDSALGHAAMSGEIGDIPKLIFLIGTIAELARQKEIKFFAVPVLSWKGQLSKPAVIARLARKLEITEKAYSSHAWDAVGIGIHIKGHFRVAKKEVGIK